MRWCLRCLVLVICTYPFAKKALTLYLARSEGHERYFGCNLMQCKVLASSYQHSIAEAPHRTGYWAKTEDEDPEDVEVRPDVVRLVRVVPIVRLASRSAQRSMSRSNGSASSNSMPSEIILA